MAGPSYSAISTDNTDDMVVNVAIPAEAVGEGLAHHRRRRSSLGKFSFKGEASWTSSVVNLLNTIVGAGVLAMPAAMSAFGMFPGILVIAFSAFCSGFGLYLQSRCAKYIERGTASFFSLSQITYPNAAVIFDAAIAIKCFGVGVSYLIIIGDLMPQVVEGFVGDVGNMMFLVDRKFWITAFMLVVIPLSFLRRLDSLKYTSFVALVSIGYLVVLVVAHYIIGDTMWNRGEVRYFSWEGPIPALRAFPIIVFAYTCHQNMFSILNEISDNSHASTTSVVSGSIGTACSIYILVAITGYLSFGSTVTGNVIMMYATSFFTTVGRAAIVVLVMFSYPLQCHPCRASIDNVLKWRPSRASFRFPPPKVTAQPVMSDLRFAIITSCVIVASYFVAMTVTSLERVLGFVGSTGSTSISFILPGVFYYKISDPNSAHPVLKEGEGEDCPWDLDTAKKRVLRKASVVLVGYGCVVMAVCLGFLTFFAE